MVWGVLRLLAGIGVIIKTPQKMVEIQKIEHFTSISFFIRFSFYLMGGLLIGGGSKKIYSNYRLLNHKDPEG
jgi:hypothetical protein